MRTTVILLALLTACNQTKPAEGKAAESSPADEGRAEGAKLNAAIECLNQHSARVFETRQAYLDSVDAKTGAAPEGHKPVLPGLYGPDPCRRLAKDAAAMTPAMPALDDKTAAYVAAFDSLNIAYE